MLQNSFTGKTRVFRKDFETRSSYSTTISRKNQQGEYENAYINLQFKKGVYLNNKTDIEVESAWLKFYMSGDKPVFYIFVNEFSLIDESQVVRSDGFMALEESETTPF